MNNKKGTKMTENQLKSLKRDISSMDSYEVKRFSQTVYMALGMDENDKKELLSAIDHRSEELLNIHGPLAENGDISDLEFN